MPVSIKPFEWEDWLALWQLRAAQLAEAGIALGDPPAEPELDSPFETDYHRLGEVYLRGAGNFWLAWSGERPIGHVGAQAMGDGIELRRMYVWAEERRRGVGALLVATLVEHARCQDVKAIELWTSPEGPGRFLYAFAGFQVVAAPGPEFSGVPPSTDEIRMRLELCEAATKAFDAWLQ
jgi:GNAT superfamily N-acetyltransferase